jgi:hypothetical protein
MFSAQAARVFVGLPMASLLTPAVPTGSFLVLRVLWFQNGLSTKEENKKKKKPPKCGR